MIKGGDDRDEEWQKTFSVVMVIEMWELCQKCFREPLRPMVRTIQMSNSLRNGSS